jgi:uncharacterized membrane protein
MSLHTHLPTPPSLAEVRRCRPRIRDVNKEHVGALSSVDRLAVFITEHVGTMGFFFLIGVWTVVWCGYNILASEVPSLGWQAFDPFPAFVAYLLMSNVIQILLRPLIMVGQNVQGRHAELRAQSDFEINIKAEREIEVILHHLEFQNAILIAMLEKLGVSREEALRTIQEHGMPDTAPQQRISPRP